MGTKINTYAQVSPQATDRVLGIDVSDTGLDANGAVKSFTTQAIADLYSVTAGDVTAHQTALSITESQISDLQSYITDLVSDTTPQLGGSLDVNGNKIVSVSNGNIDIEPHGTGNVLLGNLTFDADQTVGAGQDNYVLTYDNSAGTIGLEAASSGGLIPISKTTANGDAAVDLTLSGGYSAYVIRFDAVTPATDGVALYARISTDSRSTFKSGASDYTYHHGDALYNGSGNSSFDGSYDNTASKMRLTEAAQVGNQSTEGVSGTITLYQADPKHFWYTGELQYRATSAFHYKTLVFGVYNTMTAVTDIRFLFNSDNVASGDFHLYGIADGDA